MCTLPFQSQPNSGASSVVKGIPRNAMEKKESQTILCAGKPPSNTLTVKFHACTATRELSCRRKARNSEREGRMSKQERLVELLSESEEAGTGDNGFHLDDSAGDESRCCHFFFSHSLLKFVD